MSTVAARRAPGHIWFREDARASLCWLLLSACCIAVGAAAVLPPLHSSLSARAVRIRGVHRLVRCRRSPRAWLAVSPPLRPPLEPLSPAVRLGRSTLGRSSELRSPFDRSSPLSQSTRCSAPLAAAAAGSTRSPHWPRHPALACATSCRKRLRRCCTTRGRCCPEVARTRRRPLGLVTRSTLALPMLLWQSPLARSPALPRSLPPLLERDLPSPLDSLPQPHDTAVIAAAARFAATRCPCRADDMPACSRIARRCCVASAGAARGRARIATAALTPLEL